MSSDAGRRLEDRGGLSTNDEDQPETRQRREGPMAARQEHAARGSGRDRQCSHNQAVTSGTA